MDSQSIVKQKSDIKKRLESYVHTTLNELVIKNQKKSLSKNEKLEVL